MTIGLGRPAYLATKVKLLASLYMEQIDWTSKELKENFLKKVEEKPNE